jgi:MoaA/NifB/PqqE/SkfB family radical SAM enzyme
MNNLPDTICMLPWISIEASPMGTARPCCLAREDIAGIDLRVNTAEQAYKSEYMQDLRQRFRRGEKPDSCKLCWDEESAGRARGRAYAVAS